MTNQFRKKPVVIEAVQFTEAIRDAHLFDGQPLPEGVEIPRKHLHPGNRIVYSAEAYVQTLEGRMRVSVDDWIIKGVAGERYPCKPDIFAATYEPASPTPAAAQEEPKKTGTALSKSDELLEDDALTIAYLYGVSKGKLAAPQHQAAQPVAVVESIGGPHNLPQLLWYVDFPNIGAMVKPGDKLYTAPVAAPPLTEEQERDKVDADRYRTMRGQFRAMSLDMGGQHCWVLAGHSRLRGPSLDAACDALRSTQGGE